MFTWWHAFLHHAIGNSRQFRPHTRIFRQFLFGFFGPYDVWLNLQTDSPGWFQLPCTPCKTACSMWQPAILMFPYLDSAFRSAFSPLIFSSVYVENFGLYPKLSKMTSHYWRFGLSVFLDVMKTTQSCSLTCIMWAEVCQVLYQPLGFPEPICITCHRCRTSIVRPMKTWHGIFEGILFGHSASRVLRMQHTFVKEDWGLCYDHIAFVWVSLGLLLLLQSQHTQVHTKDEAGDDGPLQSL